MVKTRAQGKTQSGEAFRRKPRPAATIQRRFVHGISGLHLVDPRSRPYLPQIPELLNQVRSGLCCELSLTNVPLSGPVGDGETGYR